GYRIFPVNPTASEIAGLIAHPKLSAVPVRIDLVQVFRPAAEAPAIVTDAARIGAKTVWLQTGLTSPEAREIAAKTGLRYVEDRCMRTEHRRLVAKGY
ncbi:MAG: CoA-binding protein, partial [Methanobacteriota archaeon]